MEMWKTYSVLIVLVAALGCSDEIGEPPPTPVVGTSYVACGAQTPLQAGNVRAWLAYASCVPIGRFDEVEAEIDAHHEDDAVASEILDVIEESWQPDGFHGDFGFIELTFAVLQQLGNGSVLARSEALVWRPLPEDAKAVTSLEHLMGQSIACTHTRAGYAAAQKIIASHPIQSVRNTTADRLEDRRCRLKN